jgi:hypothetical protein
LQVCQCRLDIKEFLVAGYWHVQLKDVLVVKRDSHQLPDQLELLIRLKRRSVEPVHSRFLVKGEHGKGWVEQLPNKKLEELLLYAALVYA